ncbi:MAG: hypothetical protein A3G32_07440 [Deltaproteobacteria bacterium RIFCSPLOWO2_12_FULL_40_28]|nr:MAG: hypothetical protein A3C45_07485 [Deltaproteobacteria bacterium RIFCSPHIGHO2_02_FULL_40_28]OGQ19211.1 MAG: hypothetical protein A3E27_04330 [Deltaproteobacteria bacterium RIFCSPHIGHO2_12_FULL_40_32]OGQ40565.1 MAG: hypothetical protein A3I69_00740 [Deltaproteobacteria bacterium RIFCSPLOWO2_02_FULL_40_36]OGQ53800.1 MAG: hypothetical protein A3G32_07440 [Deltaproteobacteria bacterium RIFCSPLOWO2_12_FULL_40_28]
MYQTLNYLNKLQTYPEAMDEGLECEVLLTNSSLAHEYALMVLAELEDEDEKRLLVIELEKHKKAYFIARNKLSKINPDRLSSLENSLTQQKVALRDSDRVLH